MWQKIKKEINLLAIFTLISAGAMLVNVIVNYFWHVGISLRVHLLFIILHFLSLTALNWKSAMERYTLRWISLILKVVVLAVVVFTVKSFKDNIFWYFGIYWFYLIVETLLEIRFIKSEDKSHTIYKEQRL